MYRCVSKEKVSGNLHHTKTHTHTHARVLLQYPEGCLETSPVSLSHWAWPRFAKSRCGYSVAGVFSFAKENEINMLNKIYSTDEAWFYLVGYINNQKCRIRATENAHALRGSHYVHKEWCMVCVVSQTLNCSHSVQDRS
jgi:hypothetical protein